MFKKILLTIDLNNKNQEKAVNIAKEHLAKGAALHVMTVIPPIEGGGFVASFLPGDYESKLSEKIKKDLHDFTDKYFDNPKEIKHIVAHGKIYEQITELSEELGVDLIIASAATDSLKGHGFGPNVARIVRNSTCSVITVR